MRETVSRCPGCMKEKKQHPICEFCGWDEETQNQLHQLPVGTILKEQYQIGRVLGQGGFGITYLAWDLFLDRPVAIKEYFPSSIVTRDSTVTSMITSYRGEAGAEYETSKKRFLLEGKSLARFSGLPNIVEIYNVFPDNNTVYLVMEYVHGVTMRDLIKKHGPISIGKTLAILAPVMRDLQKVHEANTIHRDISPDNIMLNRHGQAKLLDFGATRQVENPDQEAMLSKATVAILKQGFAPPEQYHSRGSLGPWTDVYAMCATICTCVSGKVPEFAPERSFSDNPNSFIDSLPGVTEAQKEVLRRGMALRPVDRTPSISQLLREFQDAERGQFPKDRDRTAVMDSDRTVLMAPESGNTAGSRTAGRSYREPVPEQKSFNLRKVIGIGALILAIILSIVTAFLIHRDLSKPAIPGSLSSRSTALISENLSFQTDQSDILAL